MNESDTNFTNYKDINCNSESTLNILIHEYLVKKEFSGAAKIFKLEANVSDYVESTNSPVLLEWYSVFNEICMVRSGVCTDQDQLSRIEGIMMKLENEKRRHANIIKTDHPVPYPYRFEEDMNIYNRKYAVNDPYAYMPPPQFHPMYGPDRRNIPPEEYHRQYYNNRTPGPEYYDHMKGHMQFRGPREMSPYADQYMNKRSPKPPMNYKQQSPKLKPKIVEIPEKTEQIPKEVNLESNRKTLSLINTFKLHTQKITCMAISLESKYLFTGGSDKFLNIINLRDMKRELNFEPFNKQITDIKVKETRTEIYICVSSLEKELKLFKYKISESAEENRLECISLLNGHKGGILSIDFAEDGVFSVDIDGEIRKWNMKGEILKTVPTGDGVKSICYFGKNSLIVSDRNKVYLMDFYKNEIIRELVKESATTIKRCPGGYLMCLRNQVAVFDENLNRINTLPSAGDKPQSACLLMDNSVLVGCYQNIFQHGIGSVISIKAHDNMVTCLDSIVIFNKCYVVSCSQSGECKIWGYGMRETKSLKNSERQMLEGATCPCCDKYYSNYNSVNKSSRHRNKSRRSITPPGYWDLYMD